MAHHVDQVKVIEQCQVSPPPGSVPPTSVPLSFLDIPWVYCDPVQSIFFYHFPHSTNHFLHTLLPILKHSLSLSLQHFFHFVGNLVVPPKPHFPHFLYTHQSSISFTVSESTKEFQSLVADTARDVRDSHPLIPVLPTPSTKEDGARLFPLMAIQVTIFPNNGFTICITFEHVVADGRGFFQFMKFWSNLCRTKCDVAGSQALLPFLNREIVQDPKGLRLNFSKELWDSPIERMRKQPNNVVDYNDKVRHAFVLTRDHVEKLKKWVLVQCKSTYGDMIDIHSLHISTFVVTSSLIWACEVQSEEPNVVTVCNNDEICNLLFLGDCRNRSECSIPSTYFGNCVVNCFASLKRRKLMGDNGIVEAVIEIGREVRDFQLDAMKEVENFMSFSKGIRLLKNLVVIAGSPNLGTYNTDFGWGKPRKCEILHIEHSRTIALSDCRDDEGGVEVALVLERDQMRKFSTIFEDYLKNITATCD